MSARFRIFRRRTDDDDDDGDDGNGDVKGGEDVAPSINVITTKPKKPHHQAPKLLSFAEEEENGSPLLFSSSKSVSNSNSKASFNASKASAHKITAMKDRSTPHTSVSSNVQPRAGTYTKEALRELQKNTKTLAVPRSRSPVLPSEPVIVLKGLVKSTETDQIEHAGEVQEDEVVKPSSQTLGLTGDGDGDGDGDPKGKASSFPDPATIKAIRAKRERLRQSRAAAADYISLDTGTGHGSDEEPEFRSRIALLGDKMTSGKKGVFEDDDEPVEDDEAFKNSRDNEEEEDEEEKIWEEEQFRKGLGKRIDEPGRAPVVPKPVSIPSSSSSSSLLSPWQELEAISLTHQSELIRKAMKESIKLHKDSHLKSATLMARNDENLTSALSNVTAQEEACSSAGEKFIFMQKIHHFVSVMCHFLQDKAPYIEELEERMRELHEQRASAVFRRRELDAADEAEAGGPTGAGRRPDPPPRLDEFGRDLSLHRRAEAARRSRARAARSEGDSTTDESEGELASFAANRRMLLDTAGHVFGDASDEYSDLASVARAFETWKRLWPASYHGAHVPLSLPSVVSPYVRLELLRWDPLYSADSDFIPMPWHSCLFHYGGVPPSDPVDDLIPNLVEAVAVPVLRHRVIHCWDTLSTTQTSNVVSAVRLVITYVPPSSDALHTLLAVSRSRLSDSIRRLTFPASARGFGLSLRLLRNVSAFGDVLAAPVVEELAFDGIVAAKLVPHLRSVASDLHDAVARTERVASALRALSASRSPRMQPFTDHVTSLAESLRKRRSVGVTDHETITLARRLKKILVDVNDYDTARNVSKVFHLKEAL